MNIFKAFRGWFAELVGLEFTARTGLPPHAADPCEKWPGYGEHEIGSTQVTRKGDLWTVHQWAYTLFAFGWVAQSVFTDEESALQFAELLAKTNERQQRFNAMPERTVKTFEVRP